jgi:hypothetical protein
VLIRALTGAVIVRYVPIHDGCGGQIDTPTIDCPALLDGMVQPGPDPDNYPPIDPSEPIPDDGSELSPDTPETLPPAPVEPMPGPDDPDSVPV